MADPCALPYTFTTTASESSYENGEPLQVSRISTRIDSELLLWDAGQFMAFSAFFACKSLRKLQVSLLTFFASPFAPWQLKVQKEFFDVSTRPWITSED